MDHEEAIRNEASMRYALGELPPAERDEFEEHFADCWQCMKDVEASSAFAANARQVFQDGPAGPAPKASRRWFAWRPFPVLAFSGALNLLLVIGLCVELTTVRGTTASPAAEARPQNVEVVPVHAATRGAGQMQVVRTPQSPVILTFDLPQVFQHYRYSLVRQGSAVMAGELSVPGQTESLNLQIPAARLKPGEYRITVTGTTGADEETLGACLLEVESR